MVAVPILPVTITRTRKLVDGFNRVAAMRYNAEATIKAQIVETGEVVDIKIKDIQPNDRPVEQTPASPWPPAGTH